MMVGELTDHGVLGDAYGGANILMLEGDAAARIVCFSTALQVRLGALGQVRGQLLRMVSEAGRTAC